MMMPEWKRGRGRGRRQTKRGSERSPGRPREAQTHSGSILDFFVVLIVAFAVFVAVTSGECLERGLGFEELLLLLGFVIFVVVISGISRARARLLFLSLH